MSAIRISRLLVGLISGTVGFAAPVVTGTATEVATDAVYPSGAIYDQVVMTGAAATLRADPGQTTRVAFLDMTGDIVQVEFSGAGQLTVNLPGAGTPAAPVKYNQPGARYVAGHAILTIIGSDASTYLTIYSVGKETTRDPSIIRDDVVYDGIADLQLIQIFGNGENPNGATFGAIRAGNAHFSSRSGDTGIYAPSIQLQERVVVGDVTAFDSAIPKLWFGAFSQFGDVRVAGGSLEQPNGRPVLLEYFASMNLTAGRTSAGKDLPQQPLKGRTAGGLPQ